MSGDDTSGEGADDATGGEATGDDPDTSERSSGTTPLSDADIRDALPEDLDAAGYVGPYLFPNNNRRKIPAFIYWGLAVVCIGVWAATRADPPGIVNIGFLWAGIGLIAVGAYSYLAGWDLDVDERDALVAAVAEVGFPVGHASAQMGWRGLRSRPTWRILLYSAEDPPTKRGLVLIDGVDGSVVEGFVEDNPEDWSEL